MDQVSDSKSLLDREASMMTNPYSEDLRERALARAYARETIRAIAEALQISPSCISKWKKLRRETGELKPGKMNGHKKRTLSGANADWLRLVAASHLVRPVYDTEADGGAGCTWHQDRSARGVGFRSRRGLELQKNKPGRRAG
jgi:transposase-like protein